MNIEQLQKIQNNINQKIGPQNINKKSRNNIIEYGKNIFFNVNTKKKLNNETIENNNNENNINYTTFNIDKEMNKIDYENTTKNTFLKNFKTINPKLVIESKNQLEHKTFYKGNTFFSPLKTKNVFFFSNPKKKKKIKIKKFKKTNILYNMNQSPPIIDKEGLLMEILQTKNEIESMDIELIKAKKKRKRLEQKFLANKLIIESILDIQEENDKIARKNSFTDNKAFMTENNNVKIETENGEKQEIDNIKANNILIQNNELNYFKSKRNCEDNPIITCLKKQIINCDINLDNKNKLIEAKLNDNRVNDFLKLNSYIESKNKTLEELVNKSQTLQYIILDIETRIEYFTVKAKNYIDETNKLNALINNNNSKKLKNEKDIQYLYLEKESILKTIKLLEDEQKQVISKKVNKKKEKENVKNELKITKDMIEEKNNNEKEIIELDKNEIILKRYIEKNNILINSISNEEKYFDNKIERYLNERDNLIEKSKIPQKSRDKLKSLENEIINIKKEFEQNKNYINKHEAIKSELNKKITKISMELNNKKEENKKIEEELNIMKKKYKSQIPKEYRILYKDEPEDNKNELENAKNAGNSKDNNNCIIF